MGSNIHETLIFNTEPLECRSKQLCEEAKGRSREQARRQSCLHGSGTGMQRLSGAQCMWPSWHSGLSRAAQTGDSTVRAQSGSSLSPHCPWWPGLPPVTTLDVSPGLIPTHELHGSLPRLLQSCLSSSLLCSQLPPAVPGIFESPGLSCSIPKNPAAPWCQPQQGHLPSQHPGHCSSLRVGNEPHSVSPGFTSRAGSQLLSSPVLAGRSW